ncbi:M20/M25/M40 family metallo-hydrolase [Clostridium sp. MCC353]|uniref:M20/M25/M40 family metallo-hydrolase n=1 Tax=Clostridium sp. MCC353 TaxID=2592646 RepID=UPI001C0124C5|nr:M20/M25/M40 family metallo-hydrolase [Clostridium sp. MCC353]MBT9780012.1 M20/M25/M40 family metallo-hydrolase [Clostridium sp. MCC353]
MIKKERYKSLEQMFQYVDLHFDAMAEELCRIASLPSVEGNDIGLKAARDFIAEKMNQLGLEVSIHDIENGSSLISASDISGKKNTILFYNHYDVVPAGDLSQWATAPFDPVIKDGKLFARGISDNKGCLMARLQALEAIRAVENSLPVNLKFLFEGDEETGSPSMKKFSQMNPEIFKSITAADVCFWENSRTSDSETAWASFGVRGDVEFELRCRPIAFDVHARNGNLCPNAAWRLVWALSTMKDPITERVLIEGFYDRVIPPTDADRLVLDEFPFDEAGAKEHVHVDSFLLGKEGLELKERLYLEPSFTINGLESGEVYREEGARHIVPHSAYAKISCNLVADQKAEDIFRLVRAHLDKHGFQDIELILTDALTAVRTPVNLPITEELKHAASFVYKNPLVIELTMLGPGPASVLRDPWPNLPIIGIGPANPDCGHHSPNENMKLEDYKRNIKYTIAVLYGLEEGDIIGI